MNTARLPLKSFLLGLSLVTLWAPAVSAQDYPNRAIRFIVGFPPGGSVDVLARAVANQATKTLGQPILVENRAGASTNAASDFVAKERPDGYTVLVASDSIAINASLFKNLSFNPVTSFAPVTLAITSPQILVVRASFGVQTVAEYLTKVKASPSGVNVGLTGRGTIGHLTSELINLNQGGLKVSYVPYTGGAPAVRDLVGGHIDALYVTLPGVAGSVRGGSVIPVAVSSPKRSKAFPDVPTFAEPAAPELSIDSWQGFLVPAGTPQPIIDKLNRELVAALQSEAVAKPLADVGFEIVASAPGAFADVIKADVQRSGEIVRAANIDVE
jgi:tripartite-type tricarboxylate transporter receptor subunit TctC